MATGKKIGFVIHGLEVGGSEKFMIYIVNEFYKRGYSPVVISLGNENPLLSDLDENVKFVKILRAFRLDLSIAKKIKRVIEEEEIDKVFCVGSYSFFLTKLFLTFNKKVKFYLSLHTTQPKSVRGFLKHVLALNFVSKRDLVIFTSVNQKSYYYKYYFLSKKNDMVILNGINTEQFNRVHFLHQDVNAVKADLGYKNTDKLLLMVATIRPEKGHYYAIDALKILREKYQQQDTFLLLIGGGDAAYIKKLKDYASEKGVLDFVHFKGNHSDVRKFYYIADLFTLTSFGGETFSFAALEAMAFGLPCSLTNIGGANEMVIEGKTGVLSQSKAPLSIAESWDKLLNQNLSAYKISQFVLDRFDSRRMFNDYRQVIEHT